MKKLKRGKVPPKKAAKKATGQKRSASRTNGSGRPHAAKGPRSQVLPGMTKFRDQVLDNHCETVGECRTTMSTARADEQSALQAALRRMKEKKVDSYKHGKVELLRSPGEEKIRARVLKNVVQMADEGGPIIEDDNIDHAPNDGDLADDSDSVGD